MFDNYKKYQNKLIEKISSIPKTYYIKFFNPIDHTMPTDANTLNIGDLALIFNSNGGTDLWIYTTNGWKKTQLNNFDILYSDPTSITYDGSEYTQGFQTTYNIFQYNPTISVLEPLLTIPIETRSYYIKYLSSLGNTKPTSSDGVVNGDILLNIADSELYIWDGAWQVINRFNDDDILYINPNTYIYNSSGTSWVKNGIDYEIFNFDKNSRKNKYLLTIPNAPPSPVWKCEVNLSLSTLNNYITTKTNILQKSIGDVYDKDVRGIQVGDQIYIKQPDNKNGYGVITAVAGQSATSNITINVFMIY